MRPTLKDATDLLYALFGMVILAYGLAMTVSTPWGVSAWDVLHLGVVNHSGISLGRVSQLTGLVVISIAWLIRKEFVTFISLVNAVLVGWCIDRFLHNGLVLYVDGTAGLLYLVAGVFVYAAGMALYLAPRRGAGPRDALMMSLSTALGIQVGPIRVFLDLLVVGTGALLGGPVGIGTMIAAVTLGPWVQRLLPVATALHQNVVAAVALRKTATSSPATIPATPAPPRIDPSSAKDPDNTLRPTSHTPRPK